MTTRRQFAVTGATAAFTGFFARALAQAPAQPVIETIDGAKPADWTTAAPQDFGLPAAAMDGALQAGAKIQGLRSIVVVREARLIGERYYGGAMASDVLAINSATKSITSLLVGLALQRGTIGSLGRTVRELLPEEVARVPDAPAADVTLEQILTGRTGLEFPWTRYRELLATPDPVGFVLRLPLARANPPGWSYNDAMVSLLSAILARAEGMELAKLAARDLFTPLGIERFSWGRDQQGQAVSYATLGLRTRDLAKLAWIMINGGKWGDRAVLTPAWITQSTDPRGSAFWQVTPIKNVGYGYLWFTGTLHQRRVAWAWGYGGQFALLVPELRLAIATAAVSPKPEEVNNQTNAIMSVAARVVAAAQ
jgi:CubicO group peptidase (beta-lactamase class C family)